MNPDSDPEIRAIYVALVLTMSPVVIATMLEGQAFGVGSTASLVLAGIGLIGLRREARVVSTIPRAQVRRSRWRRKR